MMYWENEQVDINIFKEDQLSNPDDAIRFTLKILNYQSEQMEKEIPYMADLGLLRLDFTKIKHKLIPSPLEIISKLKHFMPDLIRGRIKEYIEWLRVSSNALRATNIQIDEFVKQQNALKAIEKSFPKYKNMIDIVSQQFDILKEN